MTARTSLVALLLIVSLLGTVVWLLDEPRSGLHAMVVPGREDLDGPQADQATEVSAGVADELAPTRLAGSVPAVPEAALSGPQVFLATGEVRGRLLDARGHPIGGEPVDLLVNEDQWWTQLRRDDVPEVVDRTVSDADGRFVLSARAGARQFLLAGGLHWSRLSGIEVSAGDEVELELAEGLVLSGSVVEEETGLPVPGAWVGSFSGTDKLLVRADKRGFFSLRPLPDEVVSIGAFLEGFDIGRHELVAPSWGRVQIELPPGRTIDGRVVDRRSNAGIPGASITLQLNSSGRKAGRPDPLQGQQTLVAWTAVADDEGRFSLDGCPSSQLRVAVKADGYLPTSLDRYANRALGDEQLLIVALHPAELLVGQVTVASDGSPGAGAQLLLTGVSGRITSTTAEPDGSFTLELSSWDGHGPLVVSALDAAGRRASHRVRKRARQVELALVEPLLLDVLVTGPEGPRAGAQVAITSDEAQPTLAVTDAMGRVRMVHAVAGPDIRTALVQARYGAAESLPVALSLKDSRLSEPLVLDLSAGSWIAGVVQDVYGTPLAHALVVVGYGSSGRADAAGRFRVGPLALEAGQTVNLQAHADGYRSTSQNDVPVQQALVLTLEALVSWHGRVSDALTGEPLDAFNGRVLVETFESGRSAWRSGAVSRLRGSPGEFSVEMDEAGTVKLQMRAPDYMTGESLLTVFDGVNPPPWTDIFLTQAALLDVTVSDSAGRPVQGYFVTAIPTSMAKKSAVPRGRMRNKSRSSRTGSDGKVRFNLGQGGSYRLASGPGAWLDDRDIIVRPGPPTQSYVNVGGTGVVSVVLRDEEGELLLRPKASVRSIGSGHRHSVKRRLRETSDGERLVATGLPEGHYLIEVNQRFYLKASAEVLISAGAVGHAEFVLVPAPKQGKGGRGGQRGGAKAAELQALGYSGG